MPSVEPHVQRANRRSLERAERQAERDRERRFDARTAELEATAIDGRTATPDEIRARLSALGADPVGVAVRHVGAPLEPTRDQTAAHHGQQLLSAEREVAREVDRALCRGQHVDARKLTPGELRALLELRAARM